MEYEQLKLENQLCFPFYAVSRLIIRAYQEDLDSRNCGVETTLSLKCPMYKEEFETELPITKDFFLPKKAKKL